MNAYKEFILQDLMSPKEVDGYNNFIKLHRDCEFSATIGGKVTVEVTSTGLGYIFVCRCNSCGIKKDITDTSLW
jgi:hypothetical protein